MQFNANISLTCLFKLEMMFLNLNRQVNENVALKHMNICLFNNILIRSCRFNYSYSIYKF